MTEANYKVYRRAIERELEVMHLFLVGELNLDYKDYEMCEQALYFLRWEIKHGKGEKIVLRDK